MRRKKASRQTVAAIFMLAPLISAKSFPARLPQQSNNGVLWSDTAFPPSDTDGTDEIESSDDDWADVIVNASLSQHHTIQIRNETNVIAPSTNREDTSSGSNNNNNQAISASDQALAYQSQSLQTLEKLQQMLDDTDYVTGTKAKQRTDSEPGILRKRQSSKTPGAKTQSGAASNTKLSLNTQSSNSQSRIPVVKSTSASPSANQSPSSSQPRLLDHVHTTPTSNPPGDQLWQSKDRARYKLQQLKVRQAAAARIDPGPPSGTAPAQFLRQPIQTQSDEDASDDTDDGLGYSLPNLPVYFSDAEVDSDDPESDTAGEALRRLYPQPLPASETSGNSAQARSPSDGSYYYHPHQNQALGYQPPLPYNYQPLPPHYPPPPPVNVYQQYQPTTPENAYQQPQPPRDALPHQVPLYAPYGYPPNYPYPYPPYGQYSLPQHQAYTTPENQLSNQSPLAAPQQGRIDHEKAANAIEKERPPNGSPADQQHAMKAVDNAFIPHDIHAVLASPFYPWPPAVQLSPTIQTFDQSQSLAEASSKVNVDAIVKLSLLLVIVSLACYSGVSPRILPLTEYNLQFYENMRLVSIASIVPLITSLSVFDARENDINVWINSFFVSFTFGYALTFIAEIVFATLVRLGCFHWFEPRIFSLTPKIPLPVLPWVLKEIHYRPKRITLIAADVVTSCVITPIIEEFMKLKLLQWTTALPKNFKWVMRESKKNKKKKRKIAEAIFRGPGEKDTTNANKFVTQMLAVSLGIKMCDTSRRVLMYTKAHHDSKGFYALCRGLFPIHELCGTMTALALAKRDLLGVDYKTWQVLAPAVVLHAMANYRGMKPIFKWNAATPWSEMQLSPLNKADPSTLLQLLKKGYPKLMWLIILGRVLGYCIKNYYMVNRQALKRTTTYAGRHAAFSAELATAEILKKAKQKK